MTVEDTVGQGGIADLLMPLSHGQLGSEDGGAGLVAFLGDFPEVAAFAFAHGGHHPVIDDQNIDAAQTGEQIVRLPSAQARARSRNRAAARV